MPTFTTVIQDHFEDSPSVASGHTDSVFFTSGLTPVTKDWFIFFGINEPNGTNTGWSIVTDYRSGSYVPVFSQTFGAAGVEHAMIQAFGPGDTSFLSGRTEFGTLESGQTVNSGDELRIKYNSHVGNIGKRIYLGFKITDFIYNFRISPPTEYYPNNPTGYSDIWAFEGFEESYPTGTTGTSVSKTLPAADRFATRTAHGQNGMLMAYVTWDASSSPTFTPDSGWTQEAYYDPADSLGIAVYTKLFGPDDNDYTFSGTFNSSTHFQVHISAYQVKAPPVPSPKGIYLSRIRFRGFQE